MQAQGNDFVVLDGLQHALPEMNESMVRKICDRHLGIGCDQLLVLEKHNQADAVMLIYNADGSQATNCGNGLRCVSELLMQKLTQDNVSIALADRIVSAQRTIHGIRVNMGLGCITQVTSESTDVDMGNQHRVFFGEGEVDPNLNNEFITAVNGDNVHVRIIERGSGETLACGSGACAVAMAVWQNSKSEKPLTIHMPGGAVIVSQHNKNIYLEGNVSVVFQGNYDDA